jgi:hypothetical protein
MPFLCWKRVKSQDRRSQRGSTRYHPLAPLRREDAPNNELEEAWKYYRTPRCEYPSGPGFAAARSLDQIITYDAFNACGALVQVVAHQPEADAQPALKQTGSIARSA